MRSARPPRLTSGTPGLAERATKDGERVYVAIWRDAEGKQHEQVCRDEKTGKPLNLLRAQQFRKRQLVSSKHRPSKVDRSRNPRLASYFERWRTTYTGRTRDAVRSDTRFDYACYIELHAMPIVGDLRVTEIKPRLHPGTSVVVAEGVTSPRTDVPLAGRSWGECSAPCGTGEIEVVRALGVVEAQCGCERFEDAVGGAERQRQIDGFRDLSSSLAFDDEKTPA
jgi:hypothetical protein